MKCSKCNRSFESARKLREHQRRCQVQAVTPSPVPVPTPKPVAITPVVVPTPTPVVTTPVVVPTPKPVVVTPTPVPTPPTVVTTPVPTSGVTTGAGANAPSWSGKTTYPVQQFSSALPVHHAAATAEGFKGWQGFPNAWSEAWLPTRVTYPTVSTPMGTQQVFQLQYPGQVESIAGNGQSTTSWRWAKNEYTNIAVKVSGSWVGTLSFEASSDGTTWTALNMYNLATRASASSTSGNGYWIADSGAPRTAYDYFRVRATSWTSGTATVNVGMQGGQAPARASFGDLKGNPTRLYFRMRFKTSSNWTDNGNTGTKLIFFSQANTSGQTTNHYISMTEGSTDTVSPSVGLQSTGWGYSNNINPSQTFNHGEWHDLEVVLHAGTAGNADGIAKVWMNGIQVVNSTTVPMFGSLMTPGFTNFWFDPTFGGGQHPSMNQTIQIAQFYYESAP